MYVTVHREPRQIGGNLIEIGTDKTHLLFDAGANLPPLDDLMADDSFELEGLTCEESAFDWVFISHYSNNHCNLLKKLLPGIPVFAGEETKRILNLIADFTNHPRPEINLGFRNCRSIQLDDIRVTPIGAEHFAKDACIFLIQAEGKNVLYIGDYRVAENILPEVRRMLGIAVKLDLLICSVWQGYKQTAAVKRLLDFCKERQIAVEDLHCGGHAYQDTIKNLIVSLQPKALLPIHCNTEGRTEFLSLHNNCLMLRDGECWEV